MKTLYILCNAENEKSNNYIMFGSAGSSLGRYLASSIGSCGDYSVELLNLGSPSKDRKSIKKTTSYDYDTFKIVEFKSLFKFVPPILRARKVLSEAIKYVKSRFKKGDKLMIYHSLYYSSMYKRLIKIAGIDSIVLFVAEIYSDVLKDFNKKEKELSRVRLFKKYVCMSSDLSNICCDSCEKKSIILYGAYSTKAERLSNKDIGVIDLVYSGTTSKIKNGLYMSISAMEHLNSDYLLHVYCSPDDDALALMKNKTNIIYEGHVSERELDKRLLDCDIGLAPQDPNGEFNNSSFPSKIVKYLSCGLSVVSSASRSVTDSPFKKVVDVFDPYDPSILAQHIIMVSKSLNRKENVDMIRELDSVFKTDIILLLEK